MNENERDLSWTVAATHAGDPAGFAALVSATKDRLVRVSARILGNVPDAEDAVQEAYVKAYRALAAGGFDRRCSVQTWLYRIVVHATLDAKRSRRRRPAPRESLDVQAAEGSVASAEAHVALRELADCLGVLPEEQQVAMILKAVEGFSSAEIAEIMQCSEGAVEQRLVRARAALRARDGSGERKGG